MLHEYTAKYTHSTLIFARRTPQENTGRLGGTQAGADRRDGRDGRDGAASEGGEGGSGEATAVRLRVR